MYCRYKAIFIFRYLTALYIYGFQLHMILWVFGIWDHTFLSGMLVQDTNASFYLLL